MEKYLEIILVKRIPGIIGEPRLHGTHLGPWARSWDPLGRPWYPPGTPGTPTKTTYLDTFPAPEDLDQCIRIFCRNTCFQRLPWTASCCVRRERSPVWSASRPNRGRPKVSGEGGRPIEKGVCPQGSRAKLALILAVRRSPKKVITFYGDSAV